MSQYPDRKKALVTGIETHVCVIQTVLDLLGMGYEVFLAIDGVSSQRPVDRSTAIRRMEKAGAVLTTGESSLFEMMGDQQTPEFKKVLPIFKEKRKNILPGL